ncbi:MAG: hypothetical protein JWO03_2288 [Bacteroidetes bacterium]|nr:hypothetical protein [Bacteroidota bacterium]
MTSDSIKALYYNDAIDLAIGRVYSVPYGGFRDSIFIPQTYIDTFLNALIAVYNDTIEPASDSVCRLLPIHVHCPTGLRNDRNIVVEADSNLLWTQHLKNGIIPTGYADLDSFIIPYRFTTVRGAYTNQSKINVILQSDSNYNTDALLRQKAGSRIYDAQIFPIGDDSGCSHSHGYHISDSIGTGFVDLTYEYGYDHCETGCIFFKLWKFRVYPDCTVEYLGDSLYDYSHIGINEPTSEDLRFYPIPANDKLITTTSIENMGVVVFDMSGRQWPVPYTQKEIDISSLPLGVYCLRIQNSNRSIIRKFVKE